MRIPDSWRQLFSTQGARKWVARLKVQRPAAVFPAKYDLACRPGTEDFVYADDPRLLRAKDEAFEWLSANYPTDVREDGYGGTSAVPGDWGAMLSTPGVGMDPHPIPLSDNTAFTEAAGVAQALREGDGPWLDELVRLFFGSAVPAALHFRKEGSTSFPYFTADVQYKKLMFLKVVHNLGDWFRLTLGNFRERMEATNVYHTIMLYAIYARMQPNAVKVGEDGSRVPKPRTAPTEAEARSGDYTGKTTADMRARDRHGNVIEGHFAMRVRDVFGLNGILNLVLTAVYGCFRAVYLTRFAFTYKTRDRHDKAAKAAGFKYVVGCDVKTMDKLIPAWFADEVFARLHAYLDERLVQVCATAFTAGYVAANPWLETPESYDPTYGPHPWDPEGRRAHVGLPSGIAFNPDFGKLWMTFVYVILYRDLGALHSPMQLEAFLSGKLPNHALLDSSDDATFLTNSDRVAEGLRSARSPYAVLEPETPVIYLGDVFVKVGGKVDAVPNPLTYVVNQLCREDSVDRGSDQMGSRSARAALQRYHEGQLAREFLYSATPAYADIKQGVDSILRKHLGFSPAALSSTLGRLPHLTELDQLVRANPAVLFYKVDPNDVSPEVLDEVVGTVPAVDFWAYIKPLFKPGVASE